MNSLPAAILERCVQAYRTFSMKQIFFIIVLIYLTFNSTKVVGQTRFSSNNQLLFDTQKKYVQQFCSNYGSSKPALRKKIKYDKKRIYFLNDFYNQDLSTKEIYNRMANFFSHKWSFDTIKLGAVTKYETRIASEGNLEMFISFSTFNDIIVFKRIYFRTQTITDCFQPYQYRLIQQDLNYLETNIVPLADFPFSNCGHCSFISSDTVLLDKLKKLTSSQYRFFISPSDNDINNMTWFRTDRYMMDYVVTDISKIVKEVNIKLLLTLLYSPNLILSIYAMEGLTYLIETAQIKIPFNIQQKMEEVKNSDTKIIWQNSDVVHSGLTYKELKISNQNIITKYKLK